MNISKNYFYCLTSKDLKLETDYIISNEIKYLDNVDIKSFTVEVKDSDSDTLYSTNEESSGNNGHWQILSVVRRIRDDGTIVSEKIKENVSDLYNNGDFYTRVSYAPTYYNGSSDIQSYVGLDRNYNFALDNGYGRYEIDFYLFLHVDNVEHPDSYITVSAGNRTHPSLAIAKMTKVINLFEKVKGNITATSPSFNWSAYNIKDDDVSSPSSFLTGTLNTNAVFQSDWEIYKFSTNEFIKTTEGFDIVESSENTIKLSNFEGISRTFLIGKTIKGKSSKRSGSNETFIYFMYGSPYTGSYQGDPANYWGAEVSFKLPRVSLTTFEFDNNSIEDYETSILNIDIVDFIDGELRVRQDFSSTYNSVIVTGEMWAEVISKFYNSYIQIEYKSTGQIYKKYVYTGSNTYIEIPKGEFTVKLISEPKISTDNSLHDWSSTYYSPEGVLGDSDIINVVVLDKLSGADTDIKFLKLHSSELFNNIQYHDYFPYGVYHEGEEFLQLSENDITFYGDVSNTQNSIVSIPSSIKEKNLFVKENYTRTITGVNYVNDYWKLVYTGDSIEYGARHIVFSNPLTSTTSGVILPTGTYKVKEVGNGFLILDYSKNPRSITNVSEEDLTYNTFDFSKYYWNEVFSTPIGVYSDLVVEEGNNIKNLSISDIHVVPSEEDYLAVQHIFPAVSIDDVLEESTSIKITISSELENIKVGGLVSISGFDTDAGDYNLNGDFLIKEVEDSTNLHITNLDGSVPILTGTFAENSTISKTILFGETYGTDGVSNVLVFPKRETHMFKIEKVELVGTNIYNISIDKEISLKKGKYQLVLLNRNNTTIHENLYNKLWKQTEMHRGNLLGDTFIDNYLNYEGSFYAGIKNQLSALLPSDNEFKSPFILLSLEEQITDRISTELGEEVEIILPLLNLQGEEPLFINNLYELATDTTSIGCYSPLRYKCKTTSSDIIGYVLHDLNLVLISDPETVTALSYNGNRNFTLKSPIIPESNTENIKNPTETDPIRINFIENNNGVALITTSTPHRFVEGEKIYIKNISGATAVESTPNNMIYVRTIKTSNSFTVSNTPNGAEIILTTSALTGSGICYSDKLEFEYFITYYTKDQDSGCISLPYSNLTSFNFNNQVLKFELPKHELNSDFLVKIIVGKYLTHPSEPSNIIGIDKTSTKVLEHDYQYMSNVDPTETTINYSDYESAPLYDLKTTPKLYENLLPIPNTFFTGKPHLLLGNASHVESVDQFRCTFNLTIPANRWNKSTNPTFDSTNDTHNRKLISEISFHIEDSNREVETMPVICAKIAPPVSKDNLSDLDIKLNLDF
jgi:hypothetical protein